MEGRESSERKSLFIRTIIIIILLLLAFLSTILYVYLYPKTRVNLYDLNYDPIRSFEVKRYSTLESLPDAEKAGFTFKYWTYDDFELNGGTILDKTAELTTESINLYANYVANKYKITYHVQYWDDITEQYQYKIYNSQVCDYLTSITLPTGKDKFGELLPDFSDRLGYHFVGWTTKVMSEDDPELLQHLKYAGTEYDITIPSDIDFYAFFAKNKYTINLHTGIQYELDNGNPKKDENGEYIIKNISNDPNNEQESVLTNQVRFMDPLSILTDQYNNMKLTEKNGSLAYDEYEFKGWYLDPDYTMPVATNQTLELKIQTDGRPYYEYNLNGEKKIILADDIIGDDGKNSYEFNIYSKWQRKIYEINFNKHSNASNGKLEPIYLYKVFLNEQGVIDEVLYPYDNYYNEGNFTYAGYENGGHYCKVNLATLDVVDKAFRNSNKNYRLVGWTDSNKDISSEDVKKYAWWQQEPFTEGLGENRKTGDVSYANSVYIHTKSESATLYAQWSKIYTIIFIHSAKENGKRFEFKGIDGEWFILPNMDTIIEKTGEKWTMKYKYFAGWKVGDPSNAFAPTYEETLENGDINPNYKYEIDMNGATLYAYWESEPYTITFYLNDNDNGADGGSVFTVYGTKDSPVYPVYGGAYKYFPSAPTREGYIFDGWSKTDYKDNEYSTLQRQKDDGQTITLDEAKNSSSQFLVEGHASYYASWTKDFEIKYDANGGKFVGNAKTEYKYGDKISNSRLGQNLKISLAVGEGISVSRENYTFKGWNVKLNGELVSDKLITTGKKITFDFYEIDGKYYFYDYKPKGIAIADSEKTEMILQSGKTVVLVANWEPKSYNITIKDTQPKEGQSNEKVFKVKFDQAFTFPTELDGVSIDSTMGFKLVGFSTTKGGDPVYLIGNDGSMPIIEAGTITSNKTFYTAYIQKEINLIYKARFSDESEVNIEGYNKKVDYGSLLELPNISSLKNASGKDSKLKYWYYEENIDGTITQQKVANGDPAKYHNENDELIIYGYFEVDSYQVSISFTNPFSDPNFILETQSIDKVYEKGSSITNEVYEYIISKVYEKLNEMLSDYLLRDESGNTINRIYKGYKLDGLYQSGTNKIFEVNKKFDSNNFSGLGTSTFVLNLVTRWIANDLTLTYKSSEEDGATTKTDTSYKYDSSIVLKGSDFLTLGGGKVVNSWYFKDGTTQISLGCGDTLSGDKAKLFLKNIVWDTEGMGSITFYANTEQLCSVEYYSFDGVNKEPTLIETQELKYDPIMGLNGGLLEGDIALLNDLVFVGWFFNGEEVTSDKFSTILKENSFSIKLYADLTFEKSISLIQLDGSNITETLLSSENIKVLQYNSSEKTYSYITEIVINEVPELMASQIPDGYDYYGLKCGDKVYKKGDIESKGETLAVDGNDIKLVTYFTQEYTITYKVPEGATFADDTTEDKTDTYTIGYDGKVVGLSEGVSEIKIKYSAKKTAYNFSGWKIDLGGGKLGTTLYNENDVFTPTTTTTTLVPVFVEPNKGDVFAKIILVKQEGSEEVSKTLEYDGSNQITNGYTYTFKGENGVSSEWTSLTHDLIKWKSEYDGKEYMVGETFTIPLAIVKGQEFKFYGVWIEKYTLKFTQDEEHSLATNYTKDGVVLHRGVKYDIDTLTNTPRIDGADGVEFKYWIFDDNGTERHIFEGDSIVLNDENFSEYSYISNTDGSFIHYLPKPATSTNTYILTGAWAVVTYNITLNVTDPDNSLNVLYTLTLNNVPYGTTISSREMLNYDYIYLKGESSTITDENRSALDGILALEDESRGINGWATTMDASEADANALTKIASSKTLYSVWQTKYDLSFATSAETTAFEYKDGSIVTTKHLPNDIIDVYSLNVNNVVVNVVRSIYAKGYTTVYYEDGKYYVVNGSSNEYYRVTGFTTSVSVMVGGSSTNTLSLDDSNKIPSFTFPASNVVLTPVLEKVIKVSFYDNSTETGGELVKNGEEEKYFEFLIIGETLTLSEYTHTRANFTFLGWNTDLSSDSVIESVTANSENISVYAIWASNRKAIFQISMTTSGGNTQTTLFSFLLTKDNKIKKSTLSSHLDQMEKMDDLDPLVYSTFVYNFKNYYLDGFIVSRGGSNETFNLDNLCSEDFGNTTYYNTNENVVVTLNLYDIYTITYSASDSDVEGSINTSDYFVANSTIVGKLGETGIETMVLPEPSVTRPYFKATYWSTNLSDSSATKYSLSTEEQRTLNSEKLLAIANSLKSNYKQEYALYVVWEYVPINIYVYAIADVIDTSLSGNESKAETTLLDPYPAYLSANSYANIAFTNIPNLITINGKRQFVVGNYGYNGEGATIAQLKYNDTFALNRSDLIYEVGGFRLVGFSTQCVKLGATLSEDNYFALGEDITITDAILTGGEVKLYPYYEYITKNVTIYVSNGGATVNSIFAITDGDGNLLTTETAGYVSIDSMPLENVSTISESESSKVYSLNRFTKLKITADNPSSSYTFDSFATSENYSGLYTPDGTDSNICHIDGKTLFGETLGQYDGYYMRVVYSASKVKLTISIVYGENNENTLKNGLSDNGEMTFASVDAYTTSFEETLNSATTTKVVTVNGLSVIAYTLNTSSTYYDYALYSNGSVVTLQQGKNFAVSDLPLSAKKDAEGYYTAEVVVKATPKTYRVTFIMNLGVLKTDTTMPATSEIYNGVTGFAIVGGQASVYAGSNVTLPTANDIVYAKNGRFLGFYLYGNAETYYTKYTINQDTTFYEAFDDNAYSIQYVYDGKVTIVSGIAPNSDYTIGVDEAREKVGYTLEYWTYENGTKAFDDNQTISIDKSYILYAKYKGNDVTLKYTYTGGAKSDSIENGQNITLLDPSALTDATHTDDKYIYGWSYNGNTFKAGSTIAFGDLGYTYNRESENVIELQAVYYSQYKYEINYKTTGLENGDLTNAVEFTQTTFYVRTTNASGDTYNENDLRVKISDVEPLVSGESLYFDKYEVKYTINGVPTEDTQEVLIGGILTLVAPRDNGGSMLPVSTIISYTLTPTFKSTNTQITVEYNLTNPSTDESVSTLSATLEDNSTDTIANILKDIKFNAGATFTDNYMPSVSSTEGSFESSWTLTSKSINFALTIDGLDWFKYVLKGYSVSLYIGTGIGETRTFLFGNEAQENRNLSGYSKVILTPIWEQKYTLYYYNQADNLVKTLYFDYSEDLTSIALQTQDIVSGLGEELQVFDLTDYAWVGWTKSSANNHIIADRESFVGFGKDLTLSSSERDIHLYPAQSKVYTINFVTIGIDEADNTAFVFKTLELPKIYLGISDDDTIDLSNAMLIDANKYYDFTIAKNLYSSYNEEKYEFLKFSLNEDGTNAGEKIAFSTDNIIDNKMNVYAVWQKRAYNISFTFEALENTSAKENVLKDYSFSMQKFHGDEINLNFGYNQETNVYTFDGNSSLTNGEESLESIINAMIKDENMDYLSISKMTYILGDTENDIDWSQPFVITSPINIKIVFGTPIYRISYVVTGGMTFDDTFVTENELEVGSCIITSGTNYSSIVDLSRVQASGLSFDYWTTSAKNEEVKFFVNEDGSHTIVDSDLALEKLSSSYRLKLYPHYVTSYIFNFYYFASLEALQGYYQTIAGVTDEEVIANARNTYYTKLSGIPEKLDIGTPIGLYEKDSAGNYIVEDGALKKVYLDTENTLQKTIFDDYLASNHITIILDRDNNITREIDNFQDLYSVFSDYEYTTDGEVSIDGSICLALDLDGHGHNLYYARTFGNGTTNNVYLEYELIEYEVNIQSTVVSETESGYAFDKTLSEKYNVIAEFATSEESLEDDGSDEVEDSKRRTIATSINYSYSNTKSINYKNEIYLMNYDYFKRASTSDTFIFQGWRVLEENTIDGITTYTLKTLEEVAEVTEEKDAHGNVKYWKISNIKQRLKIVAIYTERFVDVEITLASNVHNGDELKLTILSIYGSEIRDLSDMDGIIKDTENHTATYKFSVLYYSSIIITTYTDYVDSYQIKTITIHNKFGGASINGDANIPVNQDNTSNGELDGKIIVDVEYKQVSYSLRIEANQLSNSVNYPATLDTISYLIGSLESTVNTTASYGTSYNYVVDIPVDAIITSEKLGTPTINNFTFVKWQYLDKADGQWKDITTSLECKNIANSNKEIYVRAIFAPNDVSIKFYVETETYDEASGSTITIKKELIGLPEQITSVKYGSKFTLPYVVIETDSYITTGWDFGNFGEEFTILSNNNEALESLEIIAQTKPILYVVFDKGKTNYVIPNDYPSTKADNDPLNPSPNSLVSSPIVIQGNKDYYYVYLETLPNTDTLSVGEKLNSGADAITLKSNTFAIPNVEIAIADSVPFEGWVTKLDKVYSIGQTYTYIGGEEGVGDQADTITLTAKASNLYSLKFIITNPTDKDEQYSLTTNTKIDPTDVDPSITSIDLLINKGSNTKYVTLNYNDSTDQWLKFDVMNNKVIQGAYFVKTTALNYKNDYKFYGWSTEPVRAFDNIKEVLDSEYCYTDSSVANDFKYLPYYTINKNNECTALTYQQIAINLLNFIDVTVDVTGKTTFYPIWETKRSVTFEKDDGTILQTGKYGRGEIVNAPNPTEYDLTSDNSSKWIGWKKDDSNSLEFVSNKASYLFGNYSLGVLSDEIWKPLWKTGYTLTLNMNFNRDTIAGIFARYGSTQENLRDNMGYPYFDDSLSAMLKGNGNSVTIDEKTYYESYKYGDLWTENDTINLLSYKPKDEGIYPTSYALNDATWLDPDTYYTFAGWSTSQNGEVLTQNELQAYKIDENTILYAIWTARTFKVNFYQTKELAEAKGSIGLINLYTSSTASNPIIIKFGETFKVTDYETAAYIENYPYLKNQNKLRFSKWNVVSPMTQTTLNIKDANGNSQGIPLINDLYLYPEYVDEYTVIFKTANGQIIANQENNYQKVIDGQNISIKEYIEGTLQQPLGLISSISYLNNAGNFETIDKSTDNFKFDSSKIYSSDYDNKTFTIYLTITAKVCLYAPNNSTDNSCVKKSELEITPELTFTIFSGSGYYSEYTLDLSVYDNVPEFAGWFYYTSDDISSNCVYRMDDLSKAIKSYKVTVVDGEYNLVATDKNGTITYYTLDTTNGLVINLYAKLVVSETVSLGTFDSDKLIQKYAKLSVEDSQFVKIESTEKIGQDIKSITISTIYNSPIDVTFTIETEGYILNKVVASDNGIRYEAQNEAKSNSQEFENRKNAGKYNATISKSVLTRKNVNDEQKDGMFITYAFSLNSIIQNSGVFKFGITPFVFDVTYGVDSNIALMRVKENLSSDAKGFLSNKDNPNEKYTIEMFIDNKIYRVDIDENDDEIASEYNSYVLTYTSKLSGNYVNSVTFEKVPYGMSIYVTFLPQDDMLYHNESLSFGYLVGTTENSFESDPELIEVDKGSSEKITYKPIEQTSDESPFLTSYTVTANFAKNEISEVQLNLDYMDCRPTNDNSVDPWVSAITSNSKELTNYEIITRTNNEDGNTYTKYTWTWSTKELGNNTFHAGDDLTDVLSQWTNEYHAEVDQTIDTTPSSYNNLSMKQVLRYFWLGDDSIWYTYSQNKTYEQKNNDEVLKFGSLVTAENDGSVENKIYSYHKGTVVLHIDLSKAFVIEAKPRTIDYTDGKTEFEGISRANLSMSPSNTTTIEGITTINYYAYSKNESVYESVPYIEGTNATGLIIKAPFINSNLTFTAHPEGATDKHVAYKLSAWKVLNEGTIGSGVEVDNTKNYINIDTTSANNDSTIAMFAKFGTGTEKIALPEIYLRADVTPMTYNISFNNIFIKERNLSNWSLPIAYDQEIFEKNSSKYYYYAYDLSKLYNSEKHSMPKFTLACQDSYEGPKFVSPLDKEKLDEEKKAKYGDLQYIFHQWSTVLNDKNNYSIYNVLINKTNESETYTYDDITLYACYEEAQGLTFVRHGEKGVDQTHTLYIAKVGNSDQFGVSYDTNFTSKEYSLYTWTYELSNAYSNNGMFEYYLAGKDNNSSIKVSSLVDIDNAYKNNASNLVATKDYIIYPRIDLHLNVYENRFDASASYEVYTYATLGGKIIFKPMPKKDANGVIVTEDNGDIVYTKNVLLSNIILAESSNETIAPIDDTNYTFGLWYLGEGDDGYISSDADTRETLADASLYPHYNVKIMIGSGKYASSTINDANEATWDVGNNLPLLSEPSFKNITRDTAGCRADIRLEFFSTGKENNHQYAILNVIDASNVRILYTITSVASETYFNKIVFKVVTESGATYTLSENEVSLSLDDMDKGYTITPLAYPENVTITLDDFAITNLPNENEYANTLSPTPEQLTISGGSKFILANPNDYNQGSEWKVQFENLFGGTLSQYFSLTITEGFSQLSDKLCDFEWQYKEENGSKWNTFSKGADGTYNMFAYGNMSIRLAAKWITYEVKFEKMNGNNVPDTIKIDGKDWDLSAGKNYSKYSISQNLITLYKGETLTYDKTNMKFGVTTIAGNAGKTISITNLGIDGYKQGWLLKDGTGAVSALTNDADYSDTELTFVAWVEQSKDITIKADMSSIDPSLGEKYIYGYGKVSYSISDPMGAGDIGTTALSIDKSDKTYGSFTAGASSKVELTFEESSEVNHDLKKITYDNEIAIANGYNRSNIYDDQVVIGDKNAVYAKNIAGDVYVLFDAKPTETDYYVVNGSNVKLGSYTLYGGYEIKYVGYAETNKFDVSINNFWGTEVNTFTIYKQETETTSDNVVFVPSYNCYISSLESFNCSSPITMEDNAITSELKNGIIIPLRYIDQYYGDNAILVLKLNEYIHTVDLDFKVCIGNSTYDTLSEKTVYMSTSDGDFYGSSYSVNVMDTDYSATMKYDSNSVVLNMGGLSATFITGYDGKTKKAYKIDRIEIGGNECVAGSSVATEWTIENSTYVVEIYLDTVTEVYVDFKLTLPNANDLANLYVSQSGIGLTTFNDEAKFKFAVGTELSVSGTALKIGKYQEISYQDTPIYTIYGWYLDTSDGHSNYNLETRSKTLEVAGFKNTQEYELYSYDDSNAINLSKNTILTCDATIVLVADRNVLDLYFNTDYWENVDKSGWTSNTNEVEELRNYAKTQGYSGGHVQVLGGLDELQPKESNFTFYTLGDSDFLGQYNVPIPKTLESNFIECEGFSLGSTSISRTKEKYAKSAYAIVNGITEIVNDIEEIIDKDAYFDVALTGADTWMFIEYPAIASKVDVDFYTKSYGSADNESLSLPFSADASFNLPNNIDTESSSTINLYAKKSWKSRLYGTINTDNRSSNVWYCPTTLTFDAGSFYNDIAAGSECILNSFTVVSGGTEYYGVTSLDLSQYSADIAVYPEFIEKVQHTITIYGPFANTNNGVYTEKILDGEPFVWNTSLDEIVLNGSTGWYSVLSDSKVVQSLECIQDNSKNIIILNLVTLEGDEVVLEPANFDPGTYDVKNCIDIDIGEVHQDYTFNAVMLDVKDIRKTYNPPPEDDLSYNNVAFSPYSSYDPIQNVVEGVSWRNLYFDENEAKNTISPENARNYFEVGVTDATLDFERGTLVYDLSISHTTHCYCQGKSEQTDSYIYFYKVCCYCGNKLPNGGAEISNTHTNHTWGDPYIYKSDENYHYYKVKCTECGTTQNDAQQLHTISDEWSYDDLDHWKYCTVCGYQTNQDGHHIQEDKKDGKIIQTCSICGYENTINCKHKKLSEEYILWQTGAEYAVDAFEDEKHNLPCNQKGELVQECKICKSILKLGTIYWGESHDTYYEQTTNSGAVLKKGNNMVLYDDPSTIYYYHTKKCRRCSLSEGPTLCNSNGIYRHATCQSLGYKKCTICNYSNYSYKGDHVWTEYTRELSSGEICSGKSVTSPYMTYKICRDCGEYYPMLEIVGGHLGNVEISDYGWGYYKYDLHKEKGNKTYIHYGAYCRYCGGAMWINYSYIWDETYQNRIKFGPYTDEEIDVHEWDPAPWPWGNYG